MNNRKALQSAKDIYTPRLWTHFVLTFFSLAIYVFAFAAVPEYKTNGVLTLGFGYASLLLLVISLLLGPFQLFRYKRRRNPVNIDFRRDIGIWTGITGCLHVFFALQIRFGGNILAFFFNTDGTPLLNLTGISNDLGGVATIILVLLLLLSNNLSLRWLKGKRWKTLQRANYILFVLVVAHTFGYQFLAGREAVFKLGLLLLSLAVIGFQLVGFYLHVSRRRISRQS